MDNRIYQIEILKPSEINKIDINAPTTFSRISVAEWRRRHWDIPYRMKCRRPSKTTKAIIVARAGFEPATSGLWARRAVHLLYHRMLFKKKIRGRNDNRICETSYLLTL